MSKKITYFQILKYYFKQAHVAKKDVVLTIVFRVLGLGEVLLEPVLIRYLIDAIQTGGDIWKWVRYLVGVSVLNFVSWRVIEYSVLNAQLKPMRTIMTTGFMYIHKHSSRFFAENMSGSLLRKLKDGVYVYENLYDIVLFSLVTPIGLSIGAVYFLWIEDRRLGLGLLVWIVVFVSLQIILYRRKGPYEESASQSISSLSGYLADTFSNHATIEQSGSLSHESTLQSSKVNNRYTKTRKNRIVGNRIYAISGFLMNGVWIGALVYSLVLLEQGAISIAVVVMTILYVNSLCNQLRDIGNVFKRILKNLEDGREYLRIIFQNHELVDSEESASQIIENSDIVFDSVSFAYNSESSQEHGNDVLNAFSLSVNNGEHIGLVGPSGAGKSTLSKLLLRLYDTQSGTISIGGKDIHSFTLESLRSQISFVPQDPSLFHRTLRENILYGRPDATDEELYEAARRAQIHDFIISLPEGYDSLVGERGVKLSGGQRQRVAIARAILHDAPIIILDEATSSLDSVTESEIQKAMSEVMQGKTAIVIAHRLGTVKHLDRLIVLEAGTIIQEGTHQELITQLEGIYATLWEHQV